MPVEKNSFKELEKLQEEEYVKNLDKVKKSLDGNMSAFASLSNFIDLYLNKVFSYIISMSGGSLDNNDEDDNSQGQKK